MRLTVGRMKQVLSELPDDTILTLMDGADIRPLTKIKKVYLAQGDDSWDNLQMLCVEMMGSVPIKQDIGIIPIENMTWIE